MDENGNPEEIAVNVCRVNCAPSYDGKEIGKAMGDAAYGVPMMGRSWHNGAKDTRENASHYGFLFQEQAEAAIASNAKVVFLCQWNEWLVPFLTAENNTLYSMNFPIRLQDEFNEEYSRDLEPMKGGYTDAYYLQMMTLYLRLPDVAAPAWGDQFVVNRGAFRNEHPVLERCAEANVYRWEAGGEVPCAIQGQTIQLAVYAGNPRRFVYPGMQMVGQYARGRRDGFLCEWRLCSPQMAELFLYFLSIVENLLRCVHIEGGFICTRGDRHRAYIPRIF